MTVQELINLLQEVEDKSLPVFMNTYDDSTDMEVRSFEITKDRIELLQNEPVPRGPTFVR